MICPICSQELDPAAGTSHPNCAPWADDDDDAEAILLKRELMDMILWADRSSIRAQQKRIGPSEMGSICDPRIGYPLTEIPACNKDFDPWPAIMGTAMHEWLDRAINSWSKATGDKKWRTET